MGYLFTDKYSLLHFATGIVVYYWNMSFWQWFFLHALFELVENTQTGMHIINNLPKLPNGEPLWPGGKTHADSVINSLGDQFYAIAGWILAKIICEQII